MYRSTDLMFFSGMVLGTRRKKNSMSNVLDQKVMNRHRKSSVEISRLKVDTVTCFSADYLAGFCIVQS